MPTQISHNGGLVDAVLELGFDQVKYFEGDVSGTAAGFSITPPARRLTVLNKSETDDVYIRVDGEDAEVSVSFVPGDNIKIGPGCTFNMDFDSLSKVSFISDGNVFIEGLLGFKGTVC